MRWVDLRENFVRENVLDDVIKVDHIPGKQNTADIFTKEFKDVSQYLAARNSFMIEKSDFLKIQKTVRFDESTQKTYKDALTNIKKLQA